MASDLSLAAGEELDNRYLISLAAILVTFAIFAIGMCLLSFCWFLLSVHFSTLEMPKFATLGPYHGTRVYRNCVPHSRFLDLSEEKLHPLIVGLTD